MVVKIYYPEDDPIVIDEATLEKTSFGFIRVTGKEITYNYRFENSFPKKPKNVPLSRFNPFRLFNSHKTIMVPDVPDDWSISGVGLDGTNARIEYKQICLVDRSVVVNKDWIRILEE